jgi:hypothetical protein
VLACAAWALLAPALIAAQEPVQQPPTPQPVPLMTAHGVVRNSATGDPLPRALVRIEGDAAAGALTDGEGRFEIAGLPAGPQIFEVIKPGFQNSASANGMLALDDPAGLTHNVQVAAQMPDLEFALAPSCAIRGHIELSTGDQAQGIEVQLLRRAVQDGRAVWQQAMAAKTTSQGSYRFSGLPDGTYAVYTMPAMDSETASTLAAAGSAARIAREGYASVFYPDARDLAGAAKIRLRNGEEAEANLTLTLEPFHMVAASATFPGARAGASETDPDRAGMTSAAVVLDPSGHQLPYVAQYDPATRTIQALLPDGTYSLLLTATPHFPGRFSVGRETLNLQVARKPYVGSVEFSVVGHAIANLRIPLATPGIASVQLTIARTTSASAQPAGDQGADVAVMLSQAGGWIADGLSSVFAEGSATGPMEASYLPPGPYWAHARIVQKGLCESSFTAGGANLAREPVTLGIAGLAAPMELILRDDCARLTLTLPAALALTPAGEEPFYTVYVVPDFDSTVDIEPLTLRPSSGSSVALEGLTPGSYHVYTFAVPVALEYRSRAALAALPFPGQQVTLSPQSSVSLVLEAPAR